MNKKILKTIVFSIIGLFLTILLILFAAGFYLFNSQSGRNFIKTQLEVQIAKQTGGTVTINDIEPGLPSHIILKNIDIDDDNNPSTEPLLTVKEIKITWRPSMLFNKHLDINTIIVDHLTLNHLPKKNQKQEQNNKVSLTLPSITKTISSLPHISLKSLSINHFALNPKILGQTNIDELIILNATGQTQTDKGVLILNLQGQTSDLTNRIKINTDINLANNMFEGEATVSSLKDGIFSHLTKTDAPLNITIKGERLGNVNTITTLSNIGSFGILQATLSEGSDLGEKPSPNGQAPMRLEGDFRLGQKFSDLKKDIGDKIEFSLSTLIQKKGAQLQIQNITAKPGTLSGILEWQDNKNILNNMRLQMDHVFFEKFQPNTQAIFGKKISLNALITQVADNNYNLTWDVNTPTTRFTIDKAYTDLKENFTGSIKAVLKKGNHPPQIQSLTQGAAIEFISKLNVSNATIITTKDGQLSLDGKSIAKIALNHNLQSKETNGKINTTVPSMIFSRINPILKAQDDFTSIITLSGSLDDLQLALEADTPTININDNLIPSAHIVSTFKGLPLNPSGHLKAITNNEEDLLEFSIAQKNGNISIQSIDYKSNSFHLKGNANYAPLEENLTLDLSYQGARFAKPLPALSLYGEFSLTGSLSSLPTNTPLHFKAQTLGSNDVVLNDLDLIAEGSFKTLAMKTTLGALKRDDLILLNNLSLQNQLNINETIDVVINQLSGRILEDQFFESTTSANLSIGEAFNIQNLNLTYGSEGIIALNANFNPAQWQMELAGENIALTQTGTTASLNFSLDTNRNILADDASKEIAQGTFSINQQDMTLSSSTVQKAFLKGAFTWDSEKIHAYHTPNIDNDFFKFDINAPVRLERSQSQTSSLSVNTNGPLAGNIEIDGQVENITSLLTNLDTQPSPIEGIEGRVNGIVNISGTVTNPEFTINGTLKDAAFTDSQSGLSLIGLHADIMTEQSLNGNKLIFSAGGRGATQEGSDRFTIDGNIFLGEKSTVETDLSFNDLELSAGPLETLKTTGLLNVSGPLNAPNAKGNINIDRMDVAIIPQPQTGLVDIDVVTQSEITSTPAILSTKQETETESKTDEPSISYDITIKADDKIFIRGRGLESEWTSSLNVKNEGAENIVLGNIKLRRGTFDFSGRRFDVTQGEIIFDQLSANDPVVTINAEYDTGNDIIARVIANGRASDIKVELTSTPTRPPNDVMALILFGKPSEDLSAIESVQTAQALASLGGIGPFGGGGVINGLRQSTGLDLLNIDLDPTGGASSLTVGKYIADGLFVSASQDIKGQNGTVKVEYEVKKNITLESNIRQDGNQSVSANWKKDF